MTSTKPIARGRSSSIITRQTLDASSQDLVLSDEYDWGKLLNAAPKTLVCLGEAFVAATSNVIRPVQVKKTGVLQYTSLRANLQDCADHGQKAFLEAETRMTKLSNVANIINSNGGTIDKILRLCEDEVLARSDLPRRIDHMKKLSLECVQSTAVMQQKFEAWAYLAQEIKRACISSDDNARIASEKLESEEAEQNRKIEQQEKELDSAKRQLIFHRRNLAAHKKDMEVAQGKIPAGGKAVGIRAADALMNGLSTAADGVGTAFSAIASLVAAGGPTLNLKMTSEKVGPDSSPAAAEVTKKDTLRQARENYESSKQAFLESQRYYIDLEKMDRRAKDEFNDMQLQLQRLCREDVTIAETMKILSRCIHHLTKFQNHIVTLQRFFSQIHEHVSTIDSNYLAEFLGNAKQIAELPSPTPEQKETHERRLNYYLEEIRNDALSLRTNYTIAGEFAATYVQISKQHIMPGVTQVNRLMTQSVSSADRKEKVKLIVGYSRRAQSQISKVAKQRRGKVREEVLELGREVEEVGAEVGDGGMGECGERMGNEEEEGGFGDHEEDGEEEEEEWEDDGEE